MKRHRTRFSIFAFLFLFATLTGAVRADKIDDEIRARMKERHIPGAAVAVVKNGKVVRLKGYGLASMEFSVPVTKDTAFEIGSVSKQMTAAGIMLLVEDGKVNLDERISKYLPGTPEAWKDVTVRHLLTHSSGIKSYTSLTGFELSRRVKMEGFIEQLSPYPLEFTPGEKNIYSNSGFNLLAYIIQTQSGKPYMDFMRERIFRPLGMNKTTNRDPRNIIPLRAEGYEWEDEGHRGRDGSLTDLMGAGSIVSTVTDLIKWNAALNGDTFLKPESKKQIWTQFVFNNGEKSPYGFGWRISDFRGQHLIGHTGQTAGFGAANFRYTDAGINVIVLTNLGESGMGSLLATRIAKYYIPSLSLKSLKPVEEKIPGLGAKLGKVLAARREGRVEEDITAESLRRFLGTDRAKRETERMLPFGAERKIEFVETEIDGEMEYYDYRTETAKRFYLWRVSVDKDGKLSRLTLVEEE